MKKGTVEAIMWIGCSIAACISLGITQSVRSVVFLCVPIVMEILEVVREE